jgi:TRAP-type C4-dicarboxylate transport system, periplasmic component
MLISGELDFFTLMGGIRGQAVPVAEVQQVPFAFRTAAEAHEAADGALGAYLREEMAAKGIHGFPVGAFDNGMRQTSSTSRPITVPKDFEGLRIRLPAGQMFTDTFRALGAEPVTINVNGIYEALKSGKVDAQENPLAVNEVFRLYEVQKHLAMTNHMWSGFNLMANGALWRKLPEDIQATIERNAARSCAPSATIRAASTRLAHDAGRARHDLQRGRPGPVPRAHGPGLCRVAREARQQVLDPARRPCRQAGLNEYVMASCGSTEKKKE